RRAKTRQREQSASRRGPHSGCLDSTAPLQPRTRAVSFVGLDVLQGWSWLTLALAVPTYNEPLPAREPAAAGVGVGVGGRGGTAFSGVGLLCSLDFSVTSRLRRVLGTGMLRVAGISIVYNDGLTAPPEVR